MKDKEHYKQVLAGFEDDMIRCQKLLGKDDEGEILSTFRYWITHPDFAAIAGWDVSAATVAELDLPPLQSDVAHTLYVIVWPEGAVDAAQQQ